LIILLWQVVVPVLVSVEAVAVQVDCVVQSRQLAVADH
jgi:hypothetical protein